MTVQSPPRAMRDGQELQAELRAAVMSELAERQLDDPEALAARLDILPIAADGLLRRRDWTVETAMWLVAKLDLPIRVSVTRG